MNFAILLGRLSTDPKITYSPSGTASTRFTIAVLEKTEKGEEITTWHRVAAFGKAAELCSDYLSKGDVVYMEGRMHTSKLPSGKHRYIYWTEFIVTVLHSLYRRNEQGEDEPYNEIEFDFHPPGDAAFISFITSEKAPGDSPKEEDDEGDACKGSLRKRKQGWDHGFLMKPQTQKEDMRRILKNMLNHRPQGVSDDLRIK